MQQKDFVNIVLIGSVIVLVGTVGLFLFKKSEPKSTPTPISSKQLSPDLQDETSLKQRIQSIIEADLIETSPEKTVDWKTYKNEGLGFEVKYPSNWFITEKTTEIKKIEGLIEEGLALQVSLANFDYDSEKHLYSFPNPDSVLVWVFADNVHYKSYGHIREGFEKSEKPFRLDGQGASLGIYDGMGEGEDVPNISVTTVRDGIMYTIGIQYYKDGRIGFSINELLNTPYLSVFGKILSTFKFAK